MEPGETVDEPEAHRRWFRRPVVMVPLSALIIALVVGGGFFLKAWDERGAEQASVDESLEKFREEQRADDAPSLLRPAAGVYTYSAAGSERLSILGTGQDWGSEVPATVTTDDLGCWTIWLEYSTNHSQSTTYCPGDRVLEEVSGATSQTFDFVATQVTDVTEFRCDPPGQVVRLDAEAGDSWDQSCVGTSPERGTTVTSAGTNTFVGVDVLDVGGEEVDALHYRVERTLSGDQNGTERTQRWYHPETGMLLRGTRSIEVASPSPLGDIVYTEEGLLDLTSLTPRI